jgi:soluble lytic murein transglycosylase-like protein
VDTVGAIRCRTGVCWLLALLAGPGAAGFARAADVYASRAADGSVRYASQALDGTYQLLFREPGAPRAMPGREPPHKGPSIQAERLRPLIEASAARHQVPPDLVEALIAVESNFDDAAVSRKGARGAMQLMPGTAARYGLRDARALHDAAQNIDAGVRHLKDLLAQHHGNVALALAAYNAGAGAVRRHGSRIPPYAETMLYVPAVLTRIAAPPP